MMTWKKRGAKLLSVFFTGYGGGFSAVLPANYLLLPESIDLSIIFFVPIISGLTMLWPQAGKIFGEYSNGN